MVYLLTSNENGDSKMGSNDACIYKISDSVGPTNLRIIIRVLIPKGRLGN